MYLLCLTTTQNRSCLPWLLWCQIEQKLKDSFTQETPFICFPFFLWQLKSHNNVGSLYNDRLYKDLYLIISFFALSFVLNFSKPENQNLPRFRYWCDFVLLSELGNCVKVEVCVLGSLSLVVLMVSVDVKQHWTWIYYLGVSYVLVYLRFINHVQ